MLIWGLLLVRSSSKLPHTASAGQNSPGWCRSNRSWFSPRPAGPSSTAHWCSSAYSPAGRWGFADEQWNWPNPRESIKVKKQSLDDNLTLTVKCNTWIYLSVYLSFLLNVYVFFYQQFVVCHLEATDVFLKNADKCENFTYCTFRILIPTAKQHFRNDFCVWAPWFFIGTQCSPLCSGS